VSQEITLYEEEISGVSLGTFNVFDKEIVGTSRSGLKFAAGGCGCGQGSDIRLATMFVTYLCLAYARNVIERIGPLGIDAITRIVGFFVATMGGGLIFHGVVEALQDYGVIAAH
jgi:hypothetical protein